jgi:flagellar hook-associated protein 2
MAETGIFGLNTGLDTADLLQKLVALQRRPIDLVEAKKELDTQKLASFQELKSRLQTFKSLVTTLNTEGRFIATQGTFSNNSSSDTNDVLSLTTTSQASSGTFSLTVNSLAKESKLISAGVASTSGAVTQGTIKLIIGGEVTDIVIDSTNDTLDGLRLAINNSGAKVKATFLNDGDSTNPLRLLLSGTQPGTDNSVAVSGAITFTETQAAQNANLVIDGVAITKSSNTITDVLGGTVLTLSSAGSGTITLSTDLDTVKEKISNFVEGYNDLMLFLADHLSLDAEGKTTLLFGNFTVQNLQTTLRNTISTRVAGVNGDFNFLAQIGIRTQSDGTLRVDDTALTNALAKDITNVSQLFSSKGTTTHTAVTFVGFTKETSAGSYDIRVSGGVPQISISGQNNFIDAVGDGNFFAGAPGTPAEGLNFRIADLTDGSYGTINLSLGVAETFNRKLNNLVDDSLNGPLSAEIDTINSTIKDFDNTIDDMEGRLTLFEENLRNRFINLEIILSRLESQRESFSQSLDGIKSLFAAK